MVMRRFGWDNGPVTTHGLETLFRPLATMERRRLVRWIVLSIFAALLVYFGFRGYLNPEFLHQFANSLVC